MMSKTKDKNDNIRVFVRVRPSNALEVKSRSVVYVQGPREIAVRENKLNDSTKTFTFNEVFGPSSSQVDVYCSVVQPLIDEVLSGYHCTVFAYGQTGTGKTFTMEGERTPDCQGSWESDPLAGIIPRTLSHLFDELRSMQVEFAVRVSFLELYNEELFDLLSPEDFTTKLRMFEDSSKKGSVIISGLEEVSVHSKADVYNILEKGSLKRQTAATLMNAHSSRSHTVFTVTVHIRETTPEGEDVMRTGKMNLVDLAGSENIGRSGAIDKRAREAGNINQSLLTLGRVITALVEHSTHIPYRESKLTRLLQESLGGRTKTSIIATVSPSLSNIEETLSTLDYAHRAKNIQNKPEVNQRFCKKTLLKEFSSEIERLQRDLEATTQRTGVYLDHTEYEGMLAQLDQLDTESQLKTDQSHVFIEQINSKRALCDELNSKKQALEKDYEECVSAKKAQEATLATISDNTSKLFVEVQEKDYLLMHHVETTKVLSEQAHSLMDTAQNSVTNAAYLFDKLDRARDATNHNELALKNLESDLISRCSAIKDKVQLATNEAVNLIAAMEFSIERRSQDCVQPITSSSCIVNENVENLSLMVKDTKVHVSEVKVMNDNLQSGMNAAILKAEKVLLDSSKDFMNAMLSTSVKQKALLSTFCEDLTKIGSCALQGVKGQTKLWQEIEESHGIFKNELQDKLNQGFNAQNKNMDEQTTCDGELHDNYIQYQKDMSNRMAVVKAMMAEMLVLQENMASFLESTQASRCTRLSELKSVCGSAHSLVTSQMESRGKYLANVQKLHEKQTDETMEAITNIIEQSCTYPNLDEAEDRCLHHMQVVSATWNDMQKSTNLLLQENRDKCTSSVDFFTARAKEMEGILTKTVACANDELSNHNTLAQQFSEDIKCHLRRINEHLNPCTSIKSEIEACNEVVQTFTSHGVQTAIPTGATPQRSNLNIPRDLAATSPDERIVARLHQKFRVINFREMEEEDMKRVLNYSDTCGSGSDDSGVSDSELNNTQEDKENPSTKGKYKKTNCNFRTKKPLVAKNR